MHPNIGGTHLVCNGEGETKVGEEDVTVKALDELIPPHVALSLRMPIVKMDMEGSEGRALEGGRSFFSHPDLELISLELNYEYEDQRHITRRELQDLGFALSVVPFGELEEVPVTQANWTEVFAVKVAKREEEGKVDCFGGERQIYDFCCGKAQFGAMPNLECFPEAEGGGASFRRCCTSRGITGRGFAA